MVVVKMRNYNGINVLGWISYSCVWNICNSAIFATLTPYVLNEFFDKDSTTFYSIASLITTGLSAILLPAIGKTIDEKRIAFSSMIIVGFLACIFPFGFLLLKFIDNKAIIAILIVFIYVIDMFLLRIGLLSNNALLKAFDEDKRVTFSLLANFIGFSIAALALFFIFYSVDHLNCEGLMQWFCGLSPVVLISVLICVSIPFNFLSLLSPKTVIDSADNRQLLDDDFKQEKEEENKDDGEKFQERNQREMGLIKSVFSSLKHMLVVFKELSGDFEGQRTKKFLFSYLFYSGAGTVLSIFSSPYFKDIYDAKLDFTSKMQLYSLVFMLSGSLFGLVLSRFIKQKVKIQIWLLIGQTVVFIGICIAFIFLQHTIDDNSMQIAKIVFFFESFIYSWNASISRGLIASLSPFNKLGVVMGWYSSFTYLAIAIASLVFGSLSILSKAIQYMPVVLLVWSLPSFFFFGQLLKIL
eukprot:TRINITY_DN210_c0_g1_i1.p1 TRINITY_DN210_c0_g1~~TRINITY_DN210_c0_g1_i1.p1  ORF type:complete len:468 (-),score=110.52 TRINITY_DN210_c0_g1_i1:36-1439(-)